MWDIWAGGGGQVSWQGFVHYQGRGQGLRVGSVQGVEPQVGSK